MFRFVNLDVLVASNASLIENRIFLDELLFESFWSLKFCKVKPSSVSTVTSQTISLVCGTQAHKRALSSKLCEEILENPSCGIRPVIALIKVVLPAPFKPIIPTASPAFTDTEVG